MGGRGGEHHTAWNFCTAISEVEEAVSKTWAELRQLNPRHISSKLVLIHKPGQLQAQRSSRDLLSISGRQGRLAQCSAQMRAWQESKCWIFLSFSYLPRTSKTFTASCSAQNASRKDLKVHHLGNPKCFSRSQEKQRNSTLSQFFKGLEETLWPFPKLNTYTGQMCASPELKVM